MTAKGSYGTKNQGWKDSGDAIVYDDGTPLPSPIGTSELPAYWFAAQLMAFLSGPCRAGPRVSSKLVLVNFALAVAPFAKLPGFTLTVPLVPMAGAVG